MIGDVLAPTHLLLILIVALLVLGPKRLPEVGRSLGKGLRDFREAMTSYHPDNLLNGEDTTAPTAATATPPVAAAAATNPQPVAAATPVVATANSHEPEAATATEVLFPSERAKVAPEPEPQDADVVEKPAG
jgi:TatA/E family protein of Tat protein translocase